MKLLLILSILFPANQLLANYQIQPPDSLSIPSEFCITQEEYKLYSLINEYRKAFKLPEIPLSKSLSFVASQHVTDLLQNNADTGNCNYHSWSGKGKWIPCCYDIHNPDPDCINGKPAELTKYSGTAHEIIFWESIGATAQTAFDLWKETQVSKVVILNLDKWEEDEWNALGVAIKSEYASVWFGKEPDVEKETKICGTRTIIENKKNEIQNASEPLIKRKTGRYYMIVKSLNNMKDAREELKKLQSKGYMKAKIISNGKNHRVSVNDFKDKDVAQKEKSKIASQFRDAWIMAY